jgi:hypothetical protein
MFGHLHSDASTISNRGSEGNVVFTDEYANYCSSRSCSVFFWGKEIPHFFEEFEYNPLHVVIWARMTASHLFGPYFFTGSVDHASYLQMINDWLIS